MKEELANIVRTFEAVGPLVGNALKSGQLFNPQAELTEPDPDILCEYDHITREAVLACLSYAGTILENYRAKPGVKDAT